MTAGGNREGEDGSPQAENLRVASAVENVSFSKNDPGPLVTRRPVFTTRREQRL